MITNYVNGTIFSTSQEIFIEKILPINVQGFRELFVPFSFRLSQCDSLRSSN